MDMTSSCGGLGETAVPEISVVFASKTARAKSIHAMDDDETMAGWVVAVYRLSPD
jgi:hypothetical protein